MTDDHEEGKVVPLRPVPKDDWTRVAVYECECKSRRFFLTPNGAECVYCGQLAKEWP